MTKPSTSLPAGHETRLALVLNGGVSLAVWMGGVTHELDLLRHATSGAREDTVDPRDKHVFRTWKEIAAACPRTRIVIDVVAGSSAGGLNGLLLTTAIARGAALPDLREVWKQSAALEKLLAPNPAPRTSVLSGQSFEDKVREAVESIGPGNEKAQAPVTLFLPATSLAGRARLCTDGFGNDFEVRDHRRLYRFQNDEKSVRYTRDGQVWALETRRVADFVPEKADALVRAARASGSFPVAFPPVNESPIMRYRVHPRAALDDPASFVMDGGVLNNAPFDPVLATIANRSAENPYERVVVFIAPSSGRGPHEDPARIDANTAWHKVAFHATSFPQEADFRASAEELSRRLSRSVRDSHVELFERAMAENGGGELAARLTRLAKDLLCEYRHNRARGVIHDLRRRLADNNAVTLLVATPEASIDQITAIVGGEPSPSWIPPDDPRQITEPLAEGVWRWGFIPAERVLQSLAEQLNAHLLRHVLGEAQQKCLTEAAGFITERLRETAALMDAHVGQILLRVQGQGEPVLSDAVAASLIDEEFAAMDIPRVLGGLVGQAAHRYVTALRVVNIDDGTKETEQAATEAVTCCLAIEVVTRAYAAPSKVIEPPMPAFTFLRLGPDKMSRVLYEDRFADMGDRKLYGTRFQHFAGFFRSEWRESDFTWGRLDAAHHLLSLFTPESADKHRDFEKKLHEAILAVEAPPRAEPREWMKSNLRELLTSTDSELLRKATGSTDGKKALKDAADSVLDTVGLRHSLFKVVIKFLGALALRAYFAGPPAKLTRAVKSGVWIIGLLLGALAFGIGFGVSYAAFQ